MLLRFLGECGILVEKVTLIAMAFPLDNFTWGFLNMNTSESQSKSDMIKAGISLMLGMLVVFWRVVLPINVEITQSIVLLTAVLDVCLTAALIIINRKKLKDVIVRKFGTRDLIKIFFGYVLIYIVVGVFLFPRLLQPIIFLMNDMPITLDSILNPVYTVTSSAAWVAYEYFNIFPIGVFISAAIAAPVWEEISFRMAGRNLIKNSVLYVLISSALFGFIHTASFLDISILWYFVVGIGFSIVYLKTKDLRIVVGIHFINNFIVSVAMILA